MVIVLKPEISEEERRRILTAVYDRVRRNYFFNAANNMIVVETGGLELKEGLSFEGVQRIVEVSKPYKLASREFQREDTSISITETTHFHTRDLNIIAGPCTVESEEQIVLIAKQLQSMGVKVLRGGAFKPRSSPYSFMGHGVEGLKMLARAKEESGLAICTEVMDTKDVETVSHYADILQVGTRNMHNLSLLKELGRTHKPILLKRGISAKIEEWLMSAEYIMSEGNHRVILCERGIRTFEPSLRSTLDLGCVPLVKELSHLPLFVDPSHGTGVRRYVPAMSKAAVVAGAHGLLIEVHNTPDQALVDGAQSLDLPSFQKLMHDLQKLKALITHTE